MSSNPSGNFQERRAGLLSQRFKRASGEHAAWQEPELRVVDAASSQAPQAAERPPVQPIWEAEPAGGARVAGPPLAMPAPTTHAQTLWSIIPSASSRVEPGVLGHQLAAALYPAQPSPSSWKRLLQGEIYQKKQQPEVLALEIAGDQKQVRFLLRGALPAVIRVFDHLLLSYGPVKREVIDTETAGEQDPLAVQSGEAISFAELCLENPSVIPLKTAGIAQDIDPLIGVFYACSGAIAESIVPLRVVSQLVMTQAPANWSARHQTLLHRLHSRHMPSPGTRPGSEAPQIALIALVLCALTLLFLATHGLLFLFWGVALPLWLLGGSLALARLWRRWLLGLQMLRHEQAVTTKLAQRVAQTCLRLYVLGPADAPQAREAALDRLIAAYGAYKGENAWRVGKRCQLGGALIAHPGLTRSGTNSERLGPALRRSGEEYQSLCDLGQVFRARSLYERFLLWTGENRKRPILSMQEVAALWHFPSSKHPL